MLTNLPYCYFLLRVRGQPHCIGVIYVNGVEHGEKLLPEGMFCSTFKWPESAGTRVGLTAPKPERGLNQGTFADFSSRISGVCSVAHSIVFHFLSSRSAGCYCCLLFSQHFLFTAVPKDISCQTFSLWAPPLKTSASLFIGSDVSDNVFTPAASVRSW